MSGTRVYLGKWNESSQFQFSRFFLSLHVHKLLHVLVNRTCKAWTQAERWWTGWMGSKNRERWMCTTALQVTRLLHSTAWLEKMFRWGFLPRVDQTNSRWERLKHAGIRKMLPRIKKHHQFLKAYLPGLRHGHGCWMSPENTGFKIIHSPHKIE